MNNKYTEAKEKNREKISTVDETGERVWVFPKKPKGNYHNKRVAVAIVLLVFMFGAPFVKIDGAPMFLFDIINRKFILFGVIFWPQDFYIIVLMFIASIIFIVLFTIIFGRLFCGWVCPQTIFMEMVFRKIEYWIEGDYTKQKKLAKQEWDAEKVFKKGLKHTVFMAISFLIANTVLAYTLGVDELYKVITDPPSEHVTLLISVLGFTIVFYWIFAWFREQVCIIACPYGRLQGVMLDLKSMVVAYDYERGEPRGKLRKNAERTEGDCIDCKQCVHVCPTGIDIRNGTQLECINCTACMDACDDIMDLTNKPKGLIRYDSEEGISKRTGFKFTKREWSYTILLTVFMVGLSILMFSRNDLQTTILRAQGTLYTKTATGAYSNVFNLSVINKTALDIPIEIKLENKKGDVEMVGHRDMLVPERGNVKGIIIVTLPKEELDGMTTELIFGIYSEQGKLISREKTKFIGPGI